MPIDVCGLSRTYRGSRDKPDVKALVGVDLAIDDGELFGVLGPNGAGKTTLIRVLTTLLTPSAGTVRIGGRDVVRETKAVRREIGVAFGGERGLYDRLTARDNLVFAAHLYDVPRRDVKRRISEVLELVDLGDRADTRVETFSRGMKQRLHIARALVHEPSVLFLDEPTSGLDPVAARAMRELSRRLRAGGTTILMTTHEMFEADALCDRVAILTGGRVRRTGSPAEIKNSVTLDKVIEIELHDQVAADTERALRRLPGVMGCDVEPRGRVNVLSIRTAGGSPTRLVDVLRAMPDLAIGYSLERSPTLEDAYVAIVEEESTEVPV